MSNAITDQQHQQQNANFGFIRGSGIISNGSGSGANGENHSFNNSFPHTANNHATNSRATLSSANVPVKYKICFNNQSTSFTVTLLVPLSGTNGQHTNGSNQHENDTSPFQKVSAADGAPTFNEHGEPIQAYALRIPLSYLVNQSSQEASDSDVQKSSAWLDRNTLRTRIDEGGRTIGLDQQQIYHSVAAVEQSASKLPHWCPRATQSVTVDITLSDNVVTLVASAAHSTTSLQPPTRKHSIGHYDQSSSPSQRYYHHAVSSNNSMPSSSQQPHLSPSSNRSNYNVFNETSGELVATAPSFPPPPGMRSNSISTSSLSTSNHNVNIDGQNRGIYNNINNNNSFSAFSPANKNRNDDMNGSNGNRNNVFNSPLLSSSFGSWGAFPPNQNNNAAEQKQNQGQQHLKPQQLNYSNIGPTSLQEPKANEKNIFRMSSEPHSSFLGQGLNTEKTSSNPFTYQFDKDIFRSNSEVISTNTPSVDMNGSSNPMHNSHNNTRPDPSIIIGPLLKMGFNKQECEVAADAIRNLTQQSRSVPENEASVQSHSEKDNHHIHQMNDLYSNKPGQNDVERNQNGNQNHQGYDEVTTSLNNVSLGNKKEDTETQLVFHSASMEQPLPKSTANSVWGNAGKLKTIKNPTYENVERPVTKTTEAIKDSDNTSVGTRRDDYSSEDTSSQKQAQQQKMVKVLDMPPELNAFIFHCNAQTRDECLERGLFGYVVISFDFVDLIYTKYSHPKPFEHFIGVHQEANMVHIPRQRKEIYYSWLTFLRGL